MSTSTMPSMPPRPPREALADDFQFALANEHWSAAVRRETRRRHLNQLVVMLTPDELAALAADRERQRKARRAGYARTWRAEHPGQPRYATPEARAKHAERMRQWRAAHPDQARATFRRWYERHPEIARANRRAWRVANRERRNELNRLAYHRRMQDPDERARHNAKAREQRARQKQRQEVAV